MLTTSASTGSQLFTVGGTFTVPAGVSSICIAACSRGLDGSAGEANNWDGFGSGGAGGAGGDGGSLAWKNNISVAPGDTISVSFSGGSIAGARSVTDGRGGFSAGWDVTYLGGIGGAGQAHASGQNGKPGGAGGSAATWGGVGLDGGAAPGSVNGASEAGYPVDIYGVITSTSQALASYGSTIYNGSNATSYGGGGSGGSGQNHSGSGGAGPGTAGTASGGFVRFIWGSGKSFPSNANF